VSNPEILVKIGADAAGINTGVNQSNAALERLVQEVQRSNSQMQQGFMQSSLALREIARASGETAGAIGNLSSQAKPASTGMVSGFGAIGLAISGIKQSIDLVGQAIKTALGPSAEMQKLQVQFGVLLGSTQAAKQRMQELVKFSDETPFELPEVTEASKVLETLTKGALSTGEGLRLVGDVAAATGQPFNELAVWFGRLYDGLQSGRPVGEAMQRLQELGAVSGDTRAEIEKLQKEGKKGPEVWDVAKKSFEQYSGMMEAQSKTFEGLASTMQDSLGGVLREFGDQILPSASGATKDLTGMFNDLKPAAAALGWVVSSTVKVFREAFIMFKALGQQVLPMLAADFAMNIADMLTMLIGFAEKVNGLFGEFLPESWTKGIGDGLASAKAWSSGLSSSMREVGDTARKELGDVGTAMLNVYADPEEIDVPGKKKTTKKAAGPSDKEKKAAEKAAKEAEAMRLKEAELDDKMAAKKLKNMQEQEDLRIESITDEVERAREIRSKKYQEDIQKAQGNSALLLAVNRKYAADLKAIDAKATAAKEKEIKERIELEKKAAEETRKAYLSIAQSQAQMWGAMAGVMDAAYSKQSTAYKAMFALSKAFTIAQAMLAMQQSIAEGMKAGWPQNIVLMAGAAAQGAAVIADVQSVAASFAVGTPTVPQDMVAQIHKGETIVPATFAEGIRRGEMTLGGPGGGKGSNHSASLVLPEDILAAIASKGSALVKIMNNQGRVSFA
jgi:hypothetical protein